jgi:16S rRNA (guanine527-N7)-methyltransferase
LIEATKKEIEILESFQYVSRETLLNLSKYSQLLEKWNKTINLVSPTTIKDVWSRHIIDSAQIFPHLSSPADTVLADFGSGAGFPGLVLAIMGVKKTHLIESDSRKCAFLSEVVRATKVDVTVHNERVENVDLKVDVITARALAPLQDLLEYAKPFMKEHTVCFFPKGQGYEEELTAINGMWQGEITKIPSMTGSSSTILCLKRKSK